MWQKIGMIGRDGILRRKIYPRVRSRRPFVLVGPAGIGKTALLEWAYKHARGKKAFLSCSMTVKENMQEICRGWELEVLDEDGKKKGVTKASLALLERAAFKAPSGLIFLDELERATPALLRRLKALNERHTIIAAGKPPFRKEDVKRLTWGMAEIRVPPLDSRARLELSDRVTRHFGSAVSASEIASASRGYPGRIVAMSRGEVETRSARVSGEEIDLSPLFLLGICSLVAVRYIAVGLGSTDLYIIGGLGMGLGAFARFFLFRGFSKRS